jgi:hypothetical protein
MTRLKHNGQVECIRDAIVLERIRDAMLHDRANTVQYICVNITQFAKSEKQARRLRRWVMSMLGGYQTYGGWLISNHPRLTETYNADESARYESRICWLDWMIKECKAGAARKE